MAIINNNFNHKLIIFVIIYTFFVGGFISLLGLPSSMKFLVDIVWIYLFITMLLSGALIRLTKINKGIILIPAAIFILSLFSYFVNGYSVLHYLWGFRVLFRFYVFFLACILYLNPKEIIKIKKFILPVLTINVILSIYQFYALRVVHDNVGGIFGDETGGNANVNILIIVSCAFTTIYYLLHKVSLLYFISVIFLCFVSSLLSELKVFVFELIIIFVVGLLRLKKGKRSLSLISIGLVFLFSYITYHTIMYSKTGSSYFTEEYIVNYTLENSYGNEDGGVNRLSGIPIIEEFFFKKDKYIDMIGVGLGNADYNAFYESKIYSSYGWMSYTYFAQTHIFLELGWIGLFLYLLFFVNIILFLIKRKAEYNTFSYTFYLIILILAIFLTFYSRPLKLEPGYFYYFLMSFIFSDNYIFKKKQKYVKKIYK